MQHIEGQYTAVEIAAPDVADAEAQRKTLPADPTVKNFSYTVVDGEIYYRENSIMTQIELSDNAKGRVAGMVELRQIVNELIDQQLNDFPDEDIKASQAKRLNAAYDAFTAKYGLINDRKMPACLIMIPPIICSAHWKIWTRIEISIQGRYVHQADDSAGAYCHQRGYPQRSTGGVHRRAWQGGSALYGRTAGHSRQL